MTPFFVLLSILLFPLTATAQIICSPVGTSTVCGGYNSAGKNVLSTITPVGSTNVVIGDAPVLAPPVVVQPRVSPRHTLPTMERPSSYSRMLDPMHIEREPGLPLSTLDHDLPPPPFPE